MARKAKVNSTRTIPATELRAGDIIIDGLRNAVVASVRDDTINRTCTHVDIQNGGTWCYGFNSRVIVAT